MVELAHERGGRVAEVHKVAEAAAVAFVGFVLAAAGFAKVGDGAELGEEGAGVEPAVVEGVYGALCVFFPCVAGIDVADEMVADIVADVHLDQLAVLGQLDEKVDKEGVKVVLDLHVGQRAVGIVVPRVAVDVGDEDGLREGRLGVLALAAVAVPTCSDLDEAEATR